jgi:GTP cyclohydrolase IA
LFGLGFSHAMSKTTTDRGVVRHGTARYPLPGNGTHCTTRAWRSPLAELLQPGNLSLVDSEALLREILRRIGDDPDREGLQQTPDRIVRSWKELFAGYGARAEDILVTQFQAEEYDEMILLRDIEFFSTCEHHMLPFSGKAHIAYLPDEKIVGLSKLARLTNMYARRLQVQERLTCQIANDLQRVLKPKGVAVMIEGKHQCMCSRGVSKQEGKMVTSCLLGAFKENLTSRTEFLALVKG